ncbi:MAG: thioredoxin [Pseudomonadota bacterium]
MSQVKHTTETTFQADVLQADRPVLVDFYADWCAPCKAQSPLLDTLAADRADALDVVKINIDDAPDLARQFGVRSIPTLILFKEGQAQETRVGVQTQPQLESLIGAH